MAFVTRPSAVASDFVKIQEKESKPEKKEKAKKVIKKDIKKVVVPKKFAGKVLPWK